MTIVEEGGFSPWNPFVFSLGFIERLGYKYADVIVGTMPNLGEHVSNILGYPKPTYCIPMGLDEAAFSSPEELPFEYTKKYFPENKFIVAHVGSIGIANALDTFLGCAQSMQENSLIHFVIVGNGDLRNAYIAKYAHLTNLTFAPFVSKSLVQAVLSKCDLLYFSVHAPNVWRYGQSLNKVIDYMMSGKPVIASYTGYESMINESGCGSYVPAGDVLALHHGIQSYAIMDKVEREKIGKRGKEWLIQNRSYQKLAVNYLSVMDLDVNNKSSVNA
jgi:glycosyltransferase involved in cell wall biosynthesis